MPRFRVRSFQGRIFLAILFVGLVPVALALAGGAWTLYNIGTRSGTLGPWDAVAETGQDLLAEVERSGTRDPALAQAAALHREALSESVRMSRLYSFVADRAVRVLPLAALFLGLALAAVAYYIARRLARGFGAPVSELAGWTERIAHGEPLPPASAGGSPVEELAILGDALRTMARQLEEGRRKAVENARLRSWTNFARRVAHEIKNPLTPMRIAALSLGKGKEGAEADAASVLLDEIQRLDDMARTFSQYGRMPEGPRSVVDLHELVAMLAGQHGSDKVPIRLGPGPGEVLVDGHYDALERAFRNLLLNAVEAQEVGGGEVDVSIDVTQDRAEVRIEDRGTGIPDELLEEIWNPDVTTKSRGTGLGLAIVRQVVAHHDGEVAASNRPGGGARFVVRLPLRPSSDDTLSPRSA
jgi:signal transduction histidine kinase